MHTLKNKTVSEMVERRQEISCERGKLDRRQWELDREDDKLRRQISEMRTKQTQGVK